MRIVCVPALLLFVVLLALVSAGWCDTYTITTTPEQDEALQALTDKLNAQRAAMKPPVAPATRKEVVEDQLNAAVEQYRKAYQQDLEAQVIDAIRKKDAAREAELRAKLK